MTKKHEIIGEITIRRKIYADGKKDSTYYAYRYVAEEQDRGVMNNTILDAFQSFYAPLGLYKYGSQEEAIRTAIRSISILQSHIDYLNTIVNIKSQNNAHFSTNSTFNELQNSGDEISEEITTETKIAEPEQMAINLFNSFNVD